MASLAPARVRPSAISLQAAEAASVLGPTGRGVGRKEQLYQEAKKLGIEGRSKMDRATLERAVNGAKR